MTYLGLLSQDWPDLSPGAYPHSSLRLGVGGWGTGVGAFHPGSGHLVWVAQHPLTPGLGQEA